MKLEHKLIPTGEYRGYGAEPRHQYVWLLKVTEEEFASMVKPVKPPAKEGE
jgi:hypothetical protein